MAFGECWGIRFCRVARSQCIKIGTINISLLIEKGNNMLMQCDKNYIDE